MDLVRAGAVRIQLAQDVRYERADVGALPQRDLGLSLLGASRPLIEFVLRNRAMAIANIGLRTECRVTEIVPVAAGAAVRGVRFDAASGGSEMLEADLVVDASGRGALTSTLLNLWACNGRRKPRSVLILLPQPSWCRFPPMRRPDWKFVLTLPNPPTLALSAVLIPVEDRSLGCGSLTRRERATGDLGRLPPGPPRTDHADVIQRAQPRQTSRKDTEFQFSREPLEAF
jgi:2-polyprenyl-6-methoxyphenol hydroxylase-like FAD-dependent oxidoreductase